MVKTRLNHVFTTTSWELNQKGNSGLEKLDQARFRSSAMPWGWDSDWQEMQKFLTQLTQINQVQSRMSWCKTSLFKEVKLRRKCLVWKTGLAPSGIPWGSGPPSVQHSWEGRGTIFMQRLHTNWTILHHLLHFYKKRKFCSKTVHCLRAGKARRVISIQKCLTH